MFNIQQYIDIDYATEVRKARRKYNKENTTAEFFTPYEIVKNMCSRVFEKDWTDPKKTFLEPSFGSGQFIIYIIWNRIQHNINWQTALKTCYGVELMADNVAETKDRVCGMLSQLCEDFDEELARSIMDKNFVCHDFFTWNFEEWRPMTEEEIKKTKKK